MIEAIRSALRPFRFRTTTEVDFQDGIAAALDRAGIPFDREVILAPGDRIDFIAADRIGIEVKIDGSLSALTRQLQRYAAHERIRELLVITSRLRLTNLPAQLGGKPVHHLTFAGAFA